GGDMKCVDPRVSTRDNTYSACVSVTWQRCRSAIAHHRSAPPYAALMTVHEPMSDQFPTRTSFRHQCRGPIGAESAKDTGCGVGSRLVLPDQPTPKRWRTASGGWA